MCVCVFLHNPLSHTHTLFVYIFVSLSLSLSLTLSLPLSLSPSLSFFLNLTIYVIRYLKMRLSHHLSLLRYFYMCAFVYLLLCILAFVVALGVVDQFVTSAPSLASLVAVPYS